MNLTQSTLPSELEGLLNETVSAAQERAQHYFEQLAFPHERSLVLFGAGNLGRKALKGLRQVGIEPLAFSDNNESLWGTSVEGLRVYSPREAVERFASTATFVLTIWRGEGTDTMAERCQPLLDLGCEKVLNFGQLFWKFPEAYLPHYSFDLPHKVLEQSAAVKETFALWEDDASRAEYVAQIRWRLHLDFDGLPRPVKHEIYFPEDLVEVRRDEVVVDCGAFDGDTIQAFLKSYPTHQGRLIAFEADPKNFEHLRVNVSRLPVEQQSRITIHPFAVGARNEKVSFAATGTESSSVGSGPIEVNSVPLDEILAGAQPTWIKMDIEGSELDALIGARALIQETHPVLAVCVYHQQNHLWTIPKLIRELSSEYCFFLRPHLLESWDLVCYAIPRSRLKNGSTTS